MILYPVWITSPKHGEPHLPGFGFTKRAVNFEIVWSTRRTRVSRDLRDFFVVCDHPASSNLGCLFWKHPGVSRVFFLLLIYICFEAALKAYSNELTRAHFDMYIFLSASAWSLLDLVLDPKLTQHCIRTFIANKMGRIFSY